ncbi:ArsJ-associated glyceraldehyde-3-phosphate dehydrogenase [Varunaivibrio sulfuroxidans]|uniref:Glyceraldehyde-3-phosphate dehydrogenase n=1 Tax=Varunaivibrio sulfuroxidans TaxID=1773489 RepID=A0A4R3JFP1_9PROT|nr:ArsJ-associated glyceraldehyde-3-phosphate dehydrogenase [Varunaivibrio sulfuroxidans]TCS64948.1 glyceraldehyde 3-phosphate dehydrogenase [Varunaivibrio sulfuroxidans]WES29760.1 ArsJ-associated glyceraldehyde-3-phosphate dehydrogenase [Varunaivibrio sulfuroxidans]
MTTRIGINGFGRMGRLVLRALWDTPYLRWQTINERDGDGRTSAHLLNFDSVHGRWHTEATATEGAIVIGGASIAHTSFAAIEDGDWGDCDIVLECTGAFRRAAQLQAYFDQGVQKVIVAAPVKDGGALNIVYGVNDHLYDPARHHLLTAASCTTNCLAPIVKVLLETVGIRHGAITTIHDVTNTQVIVDRPHKDLRRARSALNNLIPTSTGSATAITMIYPELKGKLNGYAVRVPLLNASLTDCVFEVERPVTAEEINALFHGAADNGLANILGIEDRPLVSSDYLNDPRSCIIDGPSTLVVDNTQVKVLAWYDNEWGYVHRMGDLTRKVAATL